MHSKCFKYGGAIPVSAAFVFAHVHLQGLEGGAMAFVWVPWLLIIQTENWSANSSFSDPLLILSTIRCWNFLHSDTGAGSEWSCPHLYERTWRRPSSPEDQHRLLVLLRITFSTQNLKSKSQIAVNKALLSEKVFGSFYEDSVSRAFTMHSICPNLSCCPKNSESPPIFFSFLGGRKRLQPPPPPLRFGPYAYACKYYQKINQHTFFSATEVFPIPLSFIPFN